MTVMRKKIMHSLYVLAAIILLLRIRCNAFRDGACSEGWVRLQHTCFKFVTELKNWTEAMKNCQNLGSELANVDETEDNVALRHHLIQNYFDINEWWVVAKTVIGHKRETKNIAGIISVSVTTSENYNRSEIIKIHLLLASQLSKDSHILASLISCFYPERKCLGNHSYICERSLRLPAIIVAITIAYTKTEGFGNEMYCWLSLQDGVIWSFAGPALAILTVNIALLINVVGLIQSSMTMKDGTMIR